MNSSGGAHIMNDEATRKYLQGLKRLITFVQRAYPTDPSRWACARGAAARRPPGQPSSGRRLQPPPAAKSGAGVPPPPPAGPAGPACRPPPAAGRPPRRSVDFSATVNEARGIAGGGSTKMALLEAEAKGELPRALPVAPHHMEKDGSVQVPPKWADILARRGLVGAGDGE
jgi:hypothetical protein